MRKKIVIAVLLILFSFSAFRVFNNRSWSTITGHGGIYSSIFKTRNKLIYGTNYSRLYVSDVNNADAIQSLDLNTGSVVIQSVDGNIVYAISRDTLYKVNSKNLNIYWSFNDAGNYDLDRSEIHGNRIFLSNRNGQFYVLNARTGKLVWNYGAGMNLKMSERLVDEVLYAGPDFWVRDGKVYLEGRDGKFTVLNAKNGRVLWQKNFNEPLISNITIYRNQILLFTKTGHGLSLNKKNGDVIWDKEFNNQVMCSTTYKDNFYSRKLIFITNSGQIQLIDIVDGHVIWKSEEFGTGLNCPQVFGKDGIFTHNSGKLIKINSGNGKTLWQKEGFGKIIHAPIVINRVYVKMYVFSDMDGNVWSVSDKQKILWNFNVGYPVYSPLFISGKELFVGTANGVIFKVNKYSGLSKNNSNIFKFKIKQDFNYVDSAQIFEITLHSKSKFNNTWSEAELYGVFTAPSGREVKVYGFYYDGTDWKVRFNPPEKGNWKYVLHWKDHGALYKYKGELYSETDTSNFYLRLNPDNPKRLTVDNKTIFNGVGIQESMLDYNRNGTPLDDWATGVSEGFVATSSSGIVSYFKSDKPISLEEYIKTYGPGGAGFNLYRYSLMNANNPLYRNLETPTVFSIQEGKVADTLLSKMRANGIHTWITFFNFDVPFKNSLTPPEKEQLRSYIRYIVARYGAYTDIWEIVNEMTFAPLPREFLIKTIKNEDFENRLISTSFEDPEAPGIDIISPHWYETEEVRDSDTKTAMFIDSFNKYQGKPVVFGEQGNGKTNWDTSSSLRMRVRLWTAFFKQGIFVFWNVSDKKGITQVKPFFANIYLGDEERKYVKNLQTFSSGFDLKYKPVALITGNNSVRGYGLSDNQKNAGYLYHYENQNTPVQVNLNINNLTPGILEWYDPSTGSILFSDNCGINCNVSSPKFTHDIAFKLK